MNFQQSSHATLLTATRKHRESYRPLLFSVFILLHIGCEEQATTPRDREFSYPFQIGTTWTYRYHYTKDGTGNFGARYTEAHRAVHFWEVQSVATAGDSTQAVVRAIRTDTVRYVLTTTVPGESVDSTYIHIDTLSFTITSTKTSIMSNWSKTVIPGPFGTEMHSVPRTSNSDIIRVGFMETSERYSLAWYVNGQGLSKYTGSVLANTSWRDSLVLQAMTLQ